MNQSNKKIEIPQSIINSLFELYSKGSYDEALKKIHNINESYPNVPIIFNVAGACYKALGDLETSAKMFANAVKIQPDYFEAYKNLGITLENLNRNKASIDNLLIAISINPSYFDANYHLANVYQKVSQHENAVEFYEKAIAIEPNLAEVHFNYGNALKDLGDFDRAIQTYKKVISMKPNLAETHNNLGVIYKEIGNIELAVSSYKNAIKIKPDFIEAHNNLGILYKESFHFLKAKDSFKKVIELKPDYAETHNNLGLVYMNLGQFVDAHNCYENALEFKPDYAYSYNNLGTVLGVLGKTKAAVESYEKAIALNPDYADAYNNLGNVLRNRRKRVEALSCFEKAYSLQPNTAYLFGALLNTKMHLCIWEDFDSNILKLSKKINKNQKAIGPFALKALIDDVSIQKKAAEIFVDDQFQSNFLEYESKIHQKHSKIRVGYFSADFRLHPVTTLTAQLYEMHDRNKFEIHAFSYTKGTKDKMSIRIREGVDYFHDVLSMSNNDLVNLSRSLEIDIAVDLGGHTANSRTKVFAMSLAPIQVNYLGYPGSMHADYMDYLVADKTLIPENKQKYYSEKIIYMPDSYQVNPSKQNFEDVRLNRKGLDLPEKGFIFCCFNNAYKITPTTFKSWMNILTQVENSVLWLLVNNETSIKNLKKEAIKLGIDEKRLVFAPYISSEKHLNRIQYADLFLDTLPYNAHTTTSDALRMGLPVLTLLGKSFASRVAASLLNAVNLPELITNSQKQYESLAIELATNPKKYKIIKSKLLNNLDNAPLFNSPLFTKNLESAYEVMFEKFHQGIEPDHIYLDNEPN